MTTYCRDKKKTDAGKWNITPLIASVGGVPDEQRDAGRTGKVVGTKRTPYGLSRYGTAGGIYNGACILIVAIVTTARISGIFTLNQ